MLCFAPYEVWRIYRAMMDFLRPLEVRIHATWIAGKIPPPAVMPADPLSRSNEEPAVWAADLRKRCQLLGIPIPPPTHAPLQWEEARRRIVQIRCF